MKKTLGTFFLLKILLFSTLLVAYFFIPHNDIYYKNDFIYPPGESHTFISTLKSWDGQHYVFLADKWYENAGSSQAFYPLLPFLMRIITIVGVNPIISGYIVVTIASFGFIYFFYKFVEKIWDKDIAYLSSIFAMTFPTAFYLSRIYTESVFLFLTALFFYLLSSKKYFYAGLVTMLIPLTRPVGIFIIVPFFLWILFDKQKHKIKFMLPSFTEKVSVKFIPDYLNLSFPVIGFGIYFLFMKIFTGDPFRGFSAQNDFATGTRFENLFSLDIFIKAFYNLSTLSFIPTGIIDRVFFIIFLISLPFIYKLLGKIWFSYSVMFGSVVLLGAFSSFHRYVYVIFPMYILLAVILKKKKLEHLSLPISYMFFSFQILLNILHGLNYFIF